jgi:hypothetical protein
MISIEGLTGAAGGNGYSLVSQRNFLATAITSAGSPIEVEARAPSRDIGSAVAGRSAEIDTFNLTKYDLPHVGAMTAWQDAIVRGTSAEMVDVSKSRSALFDNSERRGEDKTPSSHCHLHRPKCSNEEC